MLFNVIDGILLQCVFLIGVNVLVLLVLTFVLGDTVMSLFDRSVFRIKALSSSFSLSFTLGVNFRE